MNYIRLEDNYYSSWDSLYKYMKSNMTRSIVSQDMLDDCRECYSFPGYKIQRYWNGYILINLRKPLENFDFMFNEDELKSLVNDCQLKFNALKDYIINELPYEGMTLNCDDYPTIKVTVDHKCSKFHIESDKDIVFELDCIDWYSISNIQEWVDKIEDLVKYSKLIY